MGILYYISYVAVAAALCFVVLSLASGLLYVSELIEEHSRAAKYYGQTGTYVIIFLHLLLYWTESLPFIPTLFSVVCHIVYLQNFSHTWPLISLSSPVFISSCILVVTDHFLWFFYFSRQATAYHEQARQYGARNVAPRLGFKEIASFFGICVWLVPLFLFLSLSANDNALPISSSTDSMASPSTSTFPLQQPQKSRVSLFRSIISSLPLSKPRRDEGIIAPHSPLPPQTPNGRYPRSSSPRPTSTYSAVVPPPRSPALEYDRQMGGSSSIRLGTPPKRASTMRGPERVGLGIRKASSPAPTDHVFRE